MPKPITGMHGLNAKLGGVTLVLLIASMILVVGNLYMLSRLKADTAVTSYASSGRMRAYQLLYLARKLFDENPELRADARREIADVISHVDERYETMRNGDSAQGIRAPTNHRIREELEDREAFWTSEVEPALARLIVASTQAAGPPDFGEVDRVMSIYLEKIDNGIDLHEMISRAQSQRFQIIQYVFVGIVLVILASMFWITRGIARRVRALATTAERIAAGELGLVAPLGGADELAMLGDSFNTMTANLQAMIETEKAARTEIERLFGAVAATADSLASGTAEILAGTTQQASGAQEQAAAVSQTVTTVDEVTQTADQAAQRAKRVADASQRSMEIGKVGRRAVEDSVGGMGTVRDQVESIAESIVALAEQAQAIGEIIATVNDIAEQTNLLALNAGIEASRAGEHGRGFQVVAAEVKALADQAKKATGQVRQILGEIQKATNSAVMATEDGQKSVNSTMKLVSQAGDTIKSMTDTIAETAQAAAQIAASSGQQAAGLEQIHQAMKSINQATNQNLASTKQQERAARELDGLGSQLKVLLAARGR
jgi:methyl-accepting chemotaxis protein